MEIKSVIPASVCALWLVLAGCSSAPGPAPGPARLVTANGVSLTLPAGAVAVPDPDHELAFDATLLPGQRFRVTIDGFPAAAADLAADVADYGRITEDRVGVTAKSFRNAQGFDISLRQFRGAAGDFNRLVALARRADTAVLVSLDAPRRVLTDNDASRLRASVRGICESLD